MNEKIALKQMNEMKKLSGKMRLAAEEWKSDFQTLIAIILSARTRDETTIAVSTELFKKFPDAKSLSKASLEEIKTIIRKINFYQNKSKSIIACAKALDENYSGKVPHDLDKLVKLPGVGRKTANVFLSEVGKDGIGVDTHVQYISRKLEWTQGSKPEKIEEDLKKLFSRKNWNKINRTLVRFGKTYLSRKEKDQVLQKIKEKYGRTY